MVVNRENGRKKLLLSTIKTPKTKKRLKLQCQYSTYRTIRICPYNRWVGIVERIWSLLWPKPRSILWSILRYCWLDNAIRSIPYGPRILYCLYVKNPMSDYKKNRWTWRWLTQLIAFWIKILYFRFLTILEFHGLHPSSGFTKKTRISDFGLSPIKKIISWISIIIFVFWKIKL